MGSAVIFAGTKVKTLKSTLNLNGLSDVISSTTDPTSVAVSAEPGSLLLNSSNGQLYRKNDSGSSTNWTTLGAGGQAGINYITNPDALTNTNGWSTYADAAGAQPVDGTGGSPSVTFTRSTTSPLRGAADFNFSKDAANRQGEGAATDFIIDLADQARVLSVSFNYEVLSGTYADGDLTVYLIADPSGTPVVIQPAGYTVMSATTGTKMQLKATFQTQATGQTYRLCLHVASTSANAYSLAIDNVTVGPQVSLTAPVMSDWQSYTPTFVGFSGSNISFFWRRSGQNIEIQGRCTVNSPTATVAQISLPSGLVTDLTTVPTIRPSGYWERSGVNNIERFCLITGGLNYFNLGDANQGNTVARLASDLITNGEVLSVSNLVIPCAGFSSSAVSSADTDTRVVAAALGLTSNQLTSNATFTKIQLSSVVLDTHGAWDPVNYRYRVPCSGIFEFSTQVVFGSTGTGYRTVMLYKNGARFVDLVSCDNPSVSNAPGLSGKSPPIPAVAGDYFELYIYQTSGGPLNVLGTASPALQTTNFGVRMLSGPAVVQATETVAARYTSTAGQPVSGPTLINYDSKEYDSHNAVTTGLGVWKFTAPISGIFRCSASALVNAYQTGSIVLELRKNGSTYAILSYQDIGTGRVQQATGSTSIKLNAGDYIQFYFVPGAASNLTPQASYVWASIERVGN